MGRFFSMRSCIGSFTLGSVLFVASACTTTTPRSSNPAEAVESGKSSRRLKTYAVSTCRVFTGITESIGALVASPLAANINVDLTVEGAETANPDLNDCRASDLEQVAGVSCNAPAAANAVRKCVITCNASIETAWLDTPRFHMTITRMSDGEILGDCGGKNAQTTGVAVDNVPANPVSEKQSPTPQPTKPQPANSP